MRGGVAGVVDEDDVAKKLRRGMIEHRMDGSQENGEQLLMEDDDDGGRKPLLVSSLRHFVPKVLPALRNVARVVRDAVKEISI